MTLHDDLGDLRAAFDDVLRPDGRLVVDPDAPQLLLRAGRRRVRRRRAFTATGSVAAIASVAVIVTATGLIGHDRHQGAPLVPPASGVSPAPSQAPVPAPSPSVNAGGCPTAAFTLPALDPAMGVTPTDAATSGSYRALAPGEKVTVATAPKGSITLVRGAPNEDFAVSVYSSGPEPLQGLTVLGSATDLYPASVTGDTGPRIPFATGGDRATNACNRWELRSTNVPDQQLMEYAKSITPAASRGAASPAVVASPAGVSSATSPTVAACPPASLVVRLGLEGSSMSHRGLVFVITNRTATTCEIRGYPTLTLLDPAGNPVIVKTALGTGYIYQDPGPSPVVVPGDGHASFGVTVGVDKSGSCGAKSLMNVRLPGEHNSFNVPLDLPPCAVSGMDVTAIVGGSAGPSH